MISAEAASYSSVGIIHVFFGQVGGLIGTIDLAHFSFNPSEGFTIMGASSQEQIFLYGNSPGDVDGDGYSDLVISVPRANYGTRRLCGGVNVLFGHNSTSHPFEDANFTSGSRGFRVFGMALESECSQGQHVGDVNGDG